MTANKVYRDPLPAVLDRRFEAVVLDWRSLAAADGRSDSRRVGQLMKSLCEAGLNVAVISAMSLKELGAQLGARPAGPGCLFLCVDGGLEIVLVNAVGEQKVHRRTASIPERRQLSDAARLVAERLAGRGLTPHITSPHAGRRRIELVGRDRRPWRGGRWPGALAEIARTAAAEAGLRGPRVTSDGHHVEIALADESDGAHWILVEMWNRGIGPGLILFIGDDFAAEGGAVLGGRAEDRQGALVEGAARSTFVMVRSDGKRSPPEAVRLNGGRHAVLRLLQDQLDRRRMHSIPHIDLAPSWIYQVDGFDHETEGAQEARLSLADGLFGTSGAPLGAREGTDPRVLAAGVYRGEGADTELLECPLWDRDGLQLSGETGLRRTLDLRTGILVEESFHQGAIRRAFRFASLSRPGTMLMRIEGPPKLVPRSRPLVAPRNVPHIAKGGSKGRPWIKVGSGLGGGVSAAAVESRSDGSHRSRTERIAAYVSDGQICPTAAAAVRSLAGAEAAGFDELLASHRAAWAQRWARADVRVEGDPQFDVTLRFALFHLISSVASAGEAATGARGLSGRAYRGHVFWDSDVFILPFLAATNPAAARAMLEYRIRRLSAARLSARAVGRTGARFPWESAFSGSDVTPSVVSTPLGKSAVIRTGLLEEHIVADVAWAAQTYVDWSGDESFAAGPGRTLIIETARYWASRIRVGEDRRAHIYGVMGPDEYHEAVDDNAFTNVMARWNLRRAAASRGVDARERARWLKLARLLVDGYDPRSGLYEQFAGFKTLEPLIIKDLAPRRPIAADLLLGADRVRDAQVIKQADVLMLHYMVPDSTAPGSLAPNLDFYEPRTAHGSSLSPGVHAALMARAGRIRPALDALRLTARLDLDDLTGATAGGLHLAAMGSLWQAVVFGFAGVRPHAGALAVDPHLPVSWQGLDIPLMYHGSSVRLRFVRDTLTVSAEKPLRMKLSDSAARGVRSGTSVFRRTGSQWQETGP